MHLKYVFLFNSISQLAELQKLILLINHSLFREVLASVPATLLPEPMIQGKLLPTIYGQAGAPWH